MCINNKLGIHLSGMSYVGEHPYICANRKFKGEDKEKENLKKGKAKGEYFIRIINSKLIKI